MNKLKLKRKTSTEKRLKVSVVNVAGKAFWYEEAARALRGRLRVVSDTASARPRARGIVLLVGDGLGVTTSTAARIFKGQRQGQQGEESILAWDRLPAVALAKVTHFLNSVLYISLTKFTLNYKIIQHQIY